MVICCTNINEFHQFLGVSNFEILLDLMTYAFINDFLYNDVLHLPVTVDNSWISQKRIPRFMLESKRFYWVS